MKSLKFLLPFLFVLTLILAASALPAFAQDPTATPAPAAVGTPAPVTAAVATPAPTGKTYLDPLPLSCDWEGIDAGSPEAVTTKFYKVPYARNTYLVIYMFMEKKSQFPAFGFDVYDAYNSTLFNRIEDERFAGWDNWSADQAGVGTLANNHIDAWDLEWVGKGNNGTADSFFMIQAHNSNTVPVYYKLCSLNRG
jgi:hypothetical protein